MTEYVILSAGYSGPKYYKLVGVTKVTETRVYYNDCGRERWAVITNVVARHASPEMLAELRTRERQYGADRNRVLQSLTEAFDSECDEIIRRYHHAQYYKE